MSLMNKWFPPTVPSTKFLTNSPTLCRAYARRICEYFLRVKACSKSGFSTWQSHCIRCFRNLPLFRSLSYICNKWSQNNMQLRGHAYNRYASARKHTCKQYSLKHYRTKYAIILYIIFALEPLRFSFFIS